MPHANHCSGCSRIIEQRKGTGSTQAILRDGPHWLHAMGPSKQVNRRTSKKDLGKRLNDVAKEGLDSHNRQVLYEACSTDTLLPRFLANYKIVLFGLRNKGHRDQNGECDDRK